MSVDVFFFNDTATTEIYTLSLHDALPIFYSIRIAWGLLAASAATAAAPLLIDVDDPAPSSLVTTVLDRKSTRLNSSHANISYAVFCLKKKHEYSTVFFTVVATLLFFIHRI